MANQGSQEWLNDRAGKVTASRIADVMAKGRGNAPSATRASYMAELIAERLTGIPKPGFATTPMQWGIDNEHLARDFYSIEAGSDVLEVGFIPHPTIANAGASPDGLVGDAGLVEIKCPNTATHIGTLRGDPIKPEYVLQMQWQMICTGRWWCDFVSYDPRLPEWFKMHIVRVEYDSVLADEITSAVIAFCDEMDAIIAELSAKYEGVF